MSKPIVFIILFFSIASTVFGQADLVKELDKHLIQIATILPKDDFIDLNKLQPVVANRSIIGLGEATHGTHEFFVYKHRLLKYLVTEENFRIFIIEGDFAGSQTMNEYISNGDVTIGKSLLDVGEGVWMTKEFVELINWTKEYNTNKSSQEKIKFYGCDMKNPFKAAAIIKEYLSEITLLTTSLERGLNEIIDRKYQGKPTKEDQNSSNILLQELTTTFQKLDAQHDCDLEIIKHCIRELDQFFERFFADSKLQITLREKFMAENIEWIYHYENQRKTIFWAHNEHVKNADKYNTQQKPTGYYLKEKFRNKYYSFGFGFNEGKVSDFNSQNQKWEVYETPKITMKKSADLILGQCSVPEFILDFETASSNILIHEFLDTKLYRRSIGFGYFPQSKKFRIYKGSKLIDTFDGLIFFRNTTPSVRMMN